MPLFGPRLDRPSAIGDEGRPRATSLTIASLVTFGLLVLAGYTAQAFSIALGLATLSGLLTIGLALLNRERFLAVFLGQLCYVFGGTGMVGLVGAVLVLAPSYGLLLAGFAVALVGLAATWADVGDRESAKTALIQGGVSYVTMLVWFVLVLFVAVAGFVAWTLLGQRATALPATPSLVVFLLATCFASLLTLLATRWLPARQLAPRDRRPRVESRLRYLRYGLVAVAGTAFVAIIAVVVAWAVGALDGVYAAVPVVASLFGALSSPFVVGPVLLVGLLVLALAVLSLLVRRATRPVDARANRLLAGVVAGFAFTVLFVPFLFSYVPLPGALGLVVAVLLVFLGPVVLLAVGATLLIAVELDVLPDRAGGPALAAGGMVLATVGTGLVGVPAPVVFACATGGMLVWDVSTFGLGVTAELGHIPETRRLELFHSVLAVTLGAVVVAALTALDVVRTGVASGVVVGPAVLVAVVGALVLLAPVRG